MDKIYKYSENDGRYIGFDFAEADPEETKLRGRYVPLVPAYSTTVEPPKVEPGYIPVWENNEWVVREYFLGEIYNKQTKEKIFWASTAGIPSGYTEKEPSSKYSKWSDADLDWVFDVDSARVDKKEEINKRRKEEDQNGFSFRDKIIQTDELSVLAIICTAQDALFAKQQKTKFSVQWVCADNTSLDLDADGVLDMNRALRAFKQSLIEKSLLLKSEVDGANSEEEINAIEWGSL